MGDNPRDGDDLNRVFDDDFVRAAQVKEDDGRHRQKTQRRDAKGARREHRRSQLAHGARRLFWYGIVAALVVVLLGVLGTGPLSFLKRDDGKSTSSAISSPSKKNKAGGATTSTIFTLERRSYSRGDCVVYDQRGVGARETRVVPCAKPHLLEMTESFEVRNRDHFPSEVQWTALFEKRCHASIEALLGTHLDPVGLFFATGVQPSGESWARGDRTIWCGVAKVSAARPSRPHQLVPFTGKVGGAPQARLAEVGSCWSGASPYPSSCRNAHEWEVVGFFDLAGKVAQPPAPNDNTAWGNLVGEACAGSARSYLGHDLVNDVHAGWQPIQPGSWIAGRRAVECTVAHYRNDQVIASSGSLRT